MDFKDELKQLSERVLKQKELIQTEEATKNAFIMPFIQMLGYDVFNPTEVIPEMDCDITKKKGEKIDYAIVLDGDPIMLIECKHWKQDLNLHNTQLARYFVSSKAKFGVLTNGVIYRFYTDLLRENIMDETPFLEIDLEKIRENQIEELKKFHKSYFDIDTILSSASELKYLAELRNAIKAEFSNPSPDFVKMLTKRVYDGVVTSKIQDQFTTLVKKSLNNYINETLSEKLGIAIQQTEESVQEQNASPQEAEISEDNEDDGIITTAEELEGFYIIKGILREAYPVDRISCRDAKSYFAILADDNNRKPICRLYFNSSSNKQIGFFDTQKNETKIKISSLDDIYEHKKELLEVMAAY